MGSLALHGESLGLGSFIYTGVVKLINVLSPITQGGE